MIYLRGDCMFPETWELFDHDIRPMQAIPLAIFHSRKEARSWVLKELRRRAKEINRVRDNWLRNQLSTSIKS